MAVTPDSKLPSISQPWGRSVDQRLDDLEQLIARNTNDSGNNSKQLNSSVQLLSQQVAALTTTQSDLSATVLDLSTRVGYGSTDTANYFLNMTTGSGTYVSSASVTFTLNEARYVQLMAVSDIFMTITSASISAQLNIRLNGTPQYANGILVNTGVAYQLQAPAVVLRTVPLSAGTYTADNYYVASGSGTGSVQYRGSSITATVLGKV